MGIDERFDQMIGNLTGFYASWAINLGLELRFFRALRDAGTSGLTAEQLASAAGTLPEPTRTWVRAAHAHELVTLEDGRATLDPALAMVLLDEERPEYLGGQFMSAVVSSLDYDRIGEFFRTGATISPRPDRYRRAVERLTRQDIAVFFAEVLGSLPELTAELVRGGRVLDVHCGGGRWLLAMAARFPELRLAGTEDAPYSVGRARVHVAESPFPDRIEIHETSPATLPDGPFDLVYFQFAVHDLADPVGVLRGAWERTGPNGRLVILDWSLPSSAADDDTPLGQLLWGVQVDMVSTGWRLRTREELQDLLREAGVPKPTVLDLPSGATVFVAQRS